MAWSRVEGWRDRFAPMRCKTTAVHVASGPPAAQLKWVSKGTLEQLTRADLLRLLEMDTTAVGIHFPVELSRHTDEGDVGSLCCTNRKGRGG